METVSTERLVDSLAINRSELPLNPFADVLCEGELLSPVFELFALSLHDTHRATWMATEARRALAQAAMQLGPDESISIAHTVTPGAHGREALSTRIWVERSATVEASTQAGGPRWNVELGSAWRCCPRAARLPQSPVGGEAAH